MTTRSPLYSALVAFLRSRLGQVLLFAAGMGALSALGLGSGGMEALVEAYTGRQLADEAAPPQEAPGPADAVEAPAPSPAAPAEDVEPVPADDAALPEDGSEPNAAPAP